MALSGTTTYFQSIQANDVIQDAFERCGIDFSKVSGNQLDSARRSIQMCISDWGNRGPNLWKVELRTTALAAAQSVINLDQDVIEVLQAYITDSSQTPPINYVVTGISRADYAALPYPTQSGSRPTQYYFQRQITPQVYLWPVQDNTTKTCAYYCWVLQQDVGDLFNQLGRQAAEVGSRALGIPRRLEESLARIEQGDLQVQIRAGETDRLLRRLALSQQSSGQSVLLGALAVAAALLAASTRPTLTAIPLVLGLPVGLNWLKLQTRLSRDGRLDRLPGTGVSPAPSPQPPPEAAG
jgi:hypothetical protein